MYDNLRTRASISTIRSRFSYASINLIWYRILFLRINPMPVSVHGMYFSSISTFLNFLILKCQDMKTTPFDTHPKTMAAAIFSFLMLAYSIRVESNGIGLNLSRFVCFFWSSTLASLVSLLLPDCIRPILYLLCFVHVVLELLQSFCGRIWSGFEHWLNDRRFCIVRHLMINRRRVPRLPI